MGRKIDLGDTSTDISALKGMANSLTEAIGKVEVLNSELDDVKNHKARIEVDDNGLKVGKKSIDRFKQELSGEKIKKLDFFNSESVKKDINELTTILDRSYDKVINQGKRLTDSQTERFVEAFGKLNQISQIAGNDFVEKYRGMFDQLRESLSSEDWSKSFGDISKSTFNAILQPIIKDFNKEWINKHKDSVYTEMARQAYESNEIQRAQIRETENEIDNLNNKRRETLEATRNEVQGIFDSFNSNRKDDQIFQIDLSKFGEIQQAFSGLIRLLNEAEIETTDLETAFQKFTSGVYIPNDQLNNARQSMSETLAEVERLRDEVQRLQLILSTTPSSDEFDKLRQDYDAAQAKIESLTSSLEYFMNVANNGYTQSEYQHMVDEASHFVAEWRNAQQELAEVKKQLEEIKAERDKLIEERNTTQGVQQDVSRSGDVVSKTVASKFNTSSLKGFVDVLKQIEEHLKAIRDGFGSVDDNSGFKNIIDSVNLLLEKLDYMQSKIDSGIFNVTVNKTGASTIDTVINEELERLTNKYKEFTSIFGDESKMFTTLSTYGNSNINYEKYFSSAALMDITDPLQRVNRLQEFFDSINKAFSDINKIEKVLKNDAKGVRREIKSLKENSEAYDFSYGEGMAKSALTEAKNRLQNINALLKMLDNVKEFEAPESSAEELSQRIKDENLSLLEDEDLQGLDKVIQQLEKISELLSDISKKDLLGDSVKILSEQLDNLVNKFSVVIESIQTTKASSAGTAVVTSTNGIDNLISSEEKARDVIEQTNNALEKQGTEQNQLTSQVTQTNSLANSNKDLAISVNEVSTATNEVEKKTGILQRFFDWLGKIKDKIKDAFSRNTESNPLLADLDKQIADIERLSSERQRAMDKLAQISERLKGLGLEANTSEYDKVQSELDETSQKADKAAESLENEKRIMATANGQSGAVAVGATQAELDSLGMLISSLDTIIKYIYQKNAAFEQEAQIVAGVTQSEITELTVLEGWLVMIRDEVKDIGDAFRNNLSFTPDIDISALEDFLNKLNKLKIDKIGLKLTGVFAWIDDFVKAINNTKINPDGLLGSLDAILGKADELKAIATIIKASKSEIEKAKGSVGGSSKKDDNSEEQRLKRYIDLLNEEYDLRTQINNADKKGYNLNLYQNEKNRLDAIEKEKEDYKDLLTNENTLSQIKKQTRDAELKYLISKQQLDKANFQQEQRSQQTSKSNFSMQASLLKQINSWISKNSLAYKTYQERLDVLTQRLNSGVTLTKNELDEIRVSFNRVVTEATQAGKTGTAFVDMLKQRWKSLAAYLSSFVSFYRVIGFGRNLVQMITEYDTALTEMRKVSDETVDTLKAFQRESFGIAESVGTTAKVIQDSTADWMRLGESLEDAKESAKDASILLNVSEFTSIDDATTSLVAMSQAFQELDKMDIIDKLNNIGKILPTHMVTYG